MRKRLVIALGLVVLAVPVVATAVTVSGTSSSQSLRQVGTWRTVPATTTSKTFIHLRGLGSRICPAGEVAATLSIKAIGAPLQAQVVIDYGASAYPGVVNFTPGASGASASFTFITTAQAFEANDHHQYQVEWRSPNGQPTTIQSATLNLTYQQGTHAC